MKAEREKIHAKVKADTVRLNGSKLELTADEETCTFLLVSEGSCTLQMGENSLLVNPGSALLLGDNDRTHYPILPGVLPSENEVDEYYLTGWEGNPLNSFAGLLNITQVHDVVVTGEGTCLLYTSDAADE